VSKKPTNQERVGFAKIVVDFFALGLEGGICPVVALGGVVELDVLQPLQQRVQLVELVQRQVQHLQLIPQVHQFNF
jgi:hypothetical protein